MSLRIHCISRTKLYYFTINCSLIENLKKAYKTRTHTEHQFASQTMNYVRDDLRLTTYDFWTGKDS